MKKYLIPLLFAAVSFNVLANTTSSATAKHKHHHKHKRTTTASQTNSGDPLLNAIAPNNKTASPRKARKTPRNSSAAQAGTPRQPKLYSHSGYAVDLNSGQTLVSKNPDVAMPIASITKLMTAMVMLDAKDDLDEYITIKEDDVDHLRNTFSRLKVGMQLRRRDLLLLALMSSENRAAFAIARTAYPGGINEFIRRMNAKAQSLGMTHTQFYDPTGLTAQNKSTATDLAKMVRAAYQYDLIREDTTTKSADVMLSPRYVHRYVNSDALVRGGNFQIELSKTGFINEAGHCLVLYAMVDGRPIVMVFLNSAGKSGRLVDALAVRNYVDRLQ